jgi:hypothetical protein
MNRRIDRCAIFSVPREITSGFRVESKKKMALKGGNAELITDGGWVFPVRSWWSG